MDEAATESDRDKKPDEQPNETKGLTKEQKSVLYQRMIEDLTQKMLKLDKRTKKYKEANNALNNLKEDIKGASTFATFDNYNKYVK